MTAKAVFLDITRLIRRGLSGPLTGIDRVERAWLCFWLAEGRAFAPVCRTAFGWRIGGRDAARAVLEALERAPAPVGWRGRVMARGMRQPALLAAFADQAGPLLTERALVAAVARQPGAIWCSVGHENLSAGLLSALGAQGVRRLVFLHDLIPLSTPADWNGPGAPERFAQGVAAAAAHADLILTPSGVVAAEVRARGVKGRVAACPLGVEPAAPDRGALPRGLAENSVYFTAIGTIEPRKDLSLLLDVWDRLAEDPPRLILAGRRGWERPEVLSRLDRHPLRGTAILEDATLGDAAIAALLQGARAHLAPSRAEGFGLPAAEAAALGTPVLAADLPVTREVLGDWPTYLPPGDPALWAAAIRAARAHPPRRKAPPRLADWTDHFNVVLSHLN